jgi:mRNA interferase YafQ
MRTIEPTTQFRRDYKREVKSKTGKTLEALLTSVIADLANDQTLAVKFRDHALTGDWKAHRDCHIRPDLVLIYQKPDETTLRLVRLGSHSELGI